MVILRLAALNLNYWAEGDARAGVIRVEVSKFRVTPEPPVRRPGPKNRRRASALVAAVSVIAAGLVASGRAHWPSLSTEPPKQPSSLDVPSDLEEQLSKCRSYSRNTGTEPDWNKAESACNGALDRCLLYTSPSPRD